LPGIELPAEFSSLKQKELVEKEI